MKIGDFIDSRAVIPLLKATTKKQALQDIAQQLAAIIAIDQRVIFETLLTREKLGSTGLGQGIAIPHGRLPGLTQVTGLFAKLEKPIDYDAVDGKPVDLIFALLSPDHAGADHLTALAKISRVMRAPAAVSKLRATNTTEGLYAVLTEPVAAPATPASAA
ncbi:PTS IIA-like nitrogen regulatory protein PtsN [Aestuariivirga litoralis]|uniref:PTS IIA-like nitrogen regulatory protein PtsN n=1 Tax=Aestuariivirga litoralis TaxID=2650924 RepID=UPI0018C63C9A|nr:PTS IIA-like nitrogen regulatory protein PtsN [Aestuariivirga litoralis]MBG1232950.1 PTS IIA-like nitrogen regulatory protein PtsN [Aestuariivirga litoralis]